jgi:hypothetical protein
MTKIVPTKMLPQEMETIFKGFFTKEQCEDFNETFGDVLNIPKSEAGKTDRE